MRIFKSLLILVVILWGLMALLVRSATPFIADYRDELAALIGERLGAPVEIGTLKARWYGLRPLVEAHDIRIGAMPEAIDVRAVTLDFALGDLLRGSPLDALRLTVDGLQLTVVRETSGQLHLEGIGALDRQSGGEHEPLPLPSKLHLINTRLLWIDHRAQKPPVSIDKIAILLEREDRTLRLRARLDTASGSADLAARLEGFLTTTDWRGDTYLRLDNLDVATLFEPYLPASYGLRSLRLDLESWGQWENARPVHTQGRFAIDDLQLHPLAEGYNPLDLRHASARFSYSRHDDRSRFGIEELRLQLDRQPWPAGRVAVELSLPQKGPRRLTAAADYLRLEDLGRILQVRLPHAALQEPLEQLRPAGEVRDLRVRTSFGEGPTDWRGTGTFTGLSTRPWHKVPGFSGLGGRLHGQSDHIVLDIESGNAGFDAPRLFRAPLTLERLQGRLDLLKLDEDGWRLFSERLAADTPHIRTETRLRLDHRPGQPLFIDLQSDFRDGDASNAHRYYPAGIMGKKLVAWLDRSIRAGRVPGGSALFHGPVDEFAFEKTRSGMFQVLFDTAGIELDYREGWPKIEGLAARVKFHGNQVEIHATEGRIYDSRIEQVDAHIPALKPVAPIEIRGRLSGPLANNLRVLREPALKARFGQFAEGLEGSGDTALDLDFRIPLGRHGDTALDGRLNFAGNTLALPAWDLKLTGVSGRLDFTLDGLAAKDIRAHTLDAPVSIDVVPLADGSTRVRAASHLGIAAIRRQLPQIPLEPARGSADFLIDVDIPPNSAPSGSPSMLSVQSGLQGIGIDLPPPFGKAPASRRELVVRLPLGGRPTPASLDYGDRVSARFSVDGRRVDVRLGGGEPKLQADAGIRIGGRLAEVDALAWQEALSTLTPNRDEGEVPVILDLAIDRLQADTIRMADLALNVAREKGQWRGVINAPNLAGSFTVPAASRVPIQVELERLHLHLSLGEVDAEPPPVPDPAAGPDPRELPGLVLSIADLRVNEARFGQLRLEAQRGYDGMHLTQLSLRDGALELDSAGRWSRHDGNTETQLGGSIRAADLGGLLVDLGYSRQVEKAGGEVSFLLSWPGDPVQFHRATFAGDITLGIGSGRLLELDPGVTRVVGLLNLNALTRRLRLDFSDIYKKGYSFDSIEGKFRFANGLAHTDDLTVLGPAGQIDLDGNTDLLARSLDQHVTVTPKLDATLPIAGTIAGGPVAGIAVLVAQKVMSKEVDRINRFEYALKGPWANPEITQLDSGGTLSKILKPLGSGAPHSAGETPDPPAGAEPGTETAAPSALDEDPGSIAPSSVEPTAGPASSEGQSAAEPAPADDGAEGEPTANPLRGLLDVLRKSQPHGADLPGAE